MNLLVKHSWTLVGLAIGILVVTLLIKVPFLFHQEILAASTDTIDLVEPLAAVNVDLIEALSLRHSTKDFQKNRTISP